MDSFETDRQNYKAPEEELTPTLEEVTDDTVREPLSQIEEARKRLAVEELEGQVKRLKDEDPSVPLDERRARHYR